MLKLEDLWVWDFWFAVDGADYHMYFLKAPKSLGDEQLRHFNASVGHAVSQDLVHWSILPDALHPSAKGWDDLAIWTGSILRKGDTWHMLYTGASKADKGLIQRIGLATSPDLVRWTRNPRNPLIEADPRWYELLDLTQWHDQAWRDPWVFYSSEDDHYHAFITARANHGPSRERGVIGHARSEDLIEWEVLPPVSEPGWFGHLEVPQLIDLNGRHIVIFSCAYETQSESWKALRPGNLQTGTHYLTSEHIFGPYRPRMDAFLVGDAQASLYSGKLIQNPAGEWVYLAFRNYAIGEAFIGEISDPFPVRISGDGDVDVLLDGGQQ